MKERLVRAAAPRGVRALLALLTVIAPGIEPPAAAEQKPASFEDLAFMVGCWRGSLESGGEIEERYTPAEGGLMLGSSRMFEGGEVRFFEFSRVERDGERLVLTPYPRGRASVSFPLVRLGDGEAVFENLEHDYPQRIVYRRGEGADTLVARIEGEQGGKMAHQEFPMRRVPCLPE